MSDIDQILAYENKLGLPAIKPQVAFPDASNAYGIGKIAATYCGLSHQPRLIPGYWVHGWMRDSYHLHPEMICPQTGDGPERRQWFARQSEAEFLKKHGYKNARAIGHPITYLSKPDVPRKPGSLLVMPRKSHGHRLDQGCPYPEVIESIRGNFSEVVVCVSPKSYTQGDWVEGFRELGYPIVRGSDTHDGNGYERIGKLLSQFEYVTTNGTGSQIAYAAWFGAKVSVWGPKADASRDGHLPRFVLNHPQYLEEFLKVLSAAELLKAEPWLGVAPHEAVTAREWAAKELGAANMLSPGELLTEFGWDPPSVYDVYADFDLISKLFREKELAARRLQRKMENLEPLQDEIVVVRKDLNRAKAELAKAEKQIAKLQNAVEERRFLLNSKAWKMFGRHVFSIEKRLSKLTPPSYAPDLPRK